MSLSNENSVNPQERIEELQQIFSQFPSWEQRYEELIRRGKSLAPLLEQEKIEPFRIKGCQSQVWLVPQLFKEERRLELRADSDSVLVKGLCALLLFVYSGASAENIQKTSSDFLEKLGLKQHLSLNRTNGLVNMIQQIKLYASLL